MMQRSSSVSEEQIAHNHPNNQKDADADTANQPLVCRMQEEACHNEEDHSCDDNSQPCKPLDWQGTHVTTYSLAVCLHTSDVSFRVAALVALASNNVLALAFRS
jgi:hypothetical protein